MTKHSLMTNPTALADDPVRLGLLNSRWGSLIHPKKRKELDQKILGKVKTHFKTVINVTDEKVFDRLWKELAEPVWTPATELTQQKQVEISKNFEKIIYNGEGIYYKAKNEGLTGDKLAIQQAIQSLCHGQAFSKDLISWKLLSTVFIAADPSALESFFLGLQQELIHLAKNTPKNEREKLVWDAYRGNILAMLPYSYPPTGTIVTVPVLIDGVYETVGYVITKIPLSLISFTSPMNALELLPKDNVKASPILSYMGTTFPGAEGFFTTLLADTYPGHHVGEYIYKKNKALISEWFKDKKDVQVVGTSLGGIMALHTVKDFGGKIAQVDAYNPPGIDADTWDKNSTEKCSINIYCQAGDIVSEIGRWPTRKNVSVLRVIPHQKGLEEGAFTSHARVLTGCEKVTIIKDDVEELNKSHRRSFFTFLHKYMGPWLVFVPTFTMLLTFETVRSVYKAANDVFNKISRRILHTYADKSNP